MTITGFCILLPTSYITIRHTQRHRINNSFAGTTALHTTRFSVQVMHTSFNNVKKVLFCSRLFDFLCSDDVLSAFHNTAFSTAVSFSLDPGEK